MIAARGAFSCYLASAVDATTVKEPGPGGSLWRLHYSVCLPSLACDFFKLTGTGGPARENRWRSIRSAPAIMFWRIAVIRPLAASATWRRRAGS